MLKAEAGSKSMEFSITTATAVVEDSLFHVFQNKPLSNNKNLSVIDLITAWAFWSQMFHMQLSLDYCNH